jgi:beta-phosphoglucomutase
MSDQSPWAVLWDVDGTLVDTAELHFQAWVALAKAIDRPFTRADFAGTFGWRNPEIIPKLFGSHYSPEEVAELGHRKEDLYRSEAEKGVSLLPGAADILSGVHSLGGQQAIGSSAPRRNIDLILRITGVSSHFAAVIAMEDTQRGKPDPEVFARGAKALGVDPARCVVLEDAPVGVQAAKAAGMRAVAVTFAQHHPADTLLAAGADLVVSSLEEVDAARLRGLLSQFV